MPNDAVDPAIFAPLKTERLTLRALRPEDAEDMHRLVNDWDVVRTLAVVPYPYDRDLADEWIASVRRDLSSGRAYHVAITGDDNGTELLLGVIGLDVDTGRRTGRLGYWIGRRFWGHGVAKEAAGRFVSWALANLDIDRIEAHVDKENPASAAVLRGIGNFEKASRGTPDSE